MRRLAIATSALVTTAVIAYAAVGTGEIVATTPTTVVTVTSTTAGGSATATLENTTAATSFTVLVSPDDTCDPEVTFNVTGGNPIAPFPANSTRNISIGCPPRGDEAM